MKQFFGICIILLISMTVFAQTDDSGVKTQTKKTSNSSSTKKKPSVSKTPQKTTKTQPKTTVKSKPKTKKETKIVYAGLNITVNEPNSEIFLSNSEGNVFEGQDSALTDENGVLEIGEVPVGNYTLVVRKTGFFDEERQIYVSGGRVNTVSIVLRASAAFLSVSANIYGASIEVENVGEYDNGIQDLLVSPGNYRVSIYKNGYVSETKTVSLNSAGQKGQISFDLRPLPINEMLTSAESSLQSGDWNEALRKAKKVLAVQPENPKANLLVGLASFRNQNPQDGVYFLSRAIGYGETVSLPVRIFNKEKNDLQLIAGNLIFRRNSLEFSAPNRADLNFLTSQAQFTELFEKYDEFGVKHISIKARGDFNGKNDRRTVRIYSQQSAVKASRKELLCTGCSSGTCPCQTEETALYDLINRWRNANFLVSDQNFTAVIYPSDDFDLLQTTKFSMKLPQNWQVLAKSENQIFAAPFGGYLKVQNTTNYHYSHGIDAVIDNNPNRFDLNQAAKNVRDSILQGNTYLTADKTATVKLSFGTCVVNTFKGTSPVSKRGEIINTYTTITPNGEILSITTVVSPEESADYEPVFRRILNSVKFR